MYDLVVFGAGITGKFVIEELAKYASEKPDVKWAVAGRNESKVKRALESASEKTCIDLKAIPVIIADVQDVESLVNMCKQSKILMNCVGPYEKYGEIVVKTCIENGCHHLDVSGEPLFLESMAVKYSDLAKEKGVCVIGACGFDSIPSDLGVTFVKDNFKGDLNSILIYLTLGAKSKEASVSIGTWNTIVNSIGNSSAMSKFRKDNKSCALPKSQFKVPDRFFFHYSEHTKGWCIPFMGSDASIVRRSQCYFYKIENERPAQVKVYFNVQSLFKAILLVIYGAFLGVFCSFECGRNLCTKYFKLFSFGFVSDETVTKEGSCNHLLVGNGWDDKLNDPAEQHKEPPNKTIVAEVHSETPGYVCTASYFMSCAAAMLEEKDKIPQKGGVYTTAAAFRRTNYVDFLKKHKIHFRVNSEVSHKTAKTEQLTAEE